MTTYLSTPGRVLLGVAVAALLGFTPALAQDSSPNADQDQRQQDQQQSDFADEQQDERSAQSDRQQQRSAEDREDRARQQDQQSDRQQQSARQQREQRDRQSGQQRWQDDRQQQQARQGDDEDSAGLGVLLQQGRDGIRVTRVFSNSPAQNAGLREGDEIISIDGQRFQSPRQLAREVREMSQDEEVEIQLRRGGEMQTVSTQLGKRQEALNLDRRGMQDQRSMARGQRWSEDRRQYGYRGERGSGYAQDQGRRTGQSSELQSEIRDLCRQVEQLSHQVARLESRISSQDRRSGTRGPSWDDRASYDSHEPTRMRDSQRRGSVDQDRQWDDRSYDRRDAGSRGQDDRASERQRDQAFDRDRN